MSKSKPKEKKKAKNTTSFIQEYKWWIIILVGILVVAYVLIYICFLGSGFLPTGVELEKTDWLAFLGTYLSFAGTLIISLIAILQSRFYADGDKKRIEAERKKTVQPILSVNIASVDSQIAGTAESFSLDKPDSIPRHKNVAIEIENAGQFPISNVIIFDKYLWQMLRPNDKKQIQVAYSDSPDAQRWKKYIIEVLEEEYERTESGIPKSFNINYSDIDGNEMFQTFILKEIDETKYYSLDGVYEV